VEAPGLSHAGKGLGQIHTKIASDSIRILTVLRFCPAGRVDSPEERGVHGFT